MFSISFRKQRNEKEENNLFALINYQNVNSLCSRRRFEEDDTEMYQQLYLENSPKKARALIG